MFKNNNLSRLFSALCFVAFVAGSSGIKAQNPLPGKEQNTPESFTEEQLQKFAQATMDVQQVQMKYQQNMMTVIKEEGMDPQRFSEISQGQQNPEATEESDISDEEMKIYQKVVEKMQSQQESMNEEMQQAITDNGLDMQQYQKMAMSIQQDPEMQQKVRAIMQEQQQK